MRRAFARPNGWPGLHALLLLLMALLHLLGLLLVAPVSTPDRFLAFPMNRAATIAAGVTCVSDFAGRSMSLKIA